MEEKERRDVEEKKANNAANGKLCMAGQIILCRRRRGM